MILPSVSNCFSSSLSSAAPVCPSIYLTNARSIFPKMDDLRASISIYGADVVIITESWLNDDVSDNLLFLNDFELFRFDRKCRKGGGVCIWVNRHLLPRLLLPVSAVPSCIELIFVRFSCVTFHILCCGIYVPPGLTKPNHDLITDFLISEFDRLLMLFPNDKLVIAGDFNDFSIDFLSDSFSLISRVTNATRLEAILDHILIDESLNNFYPDFADVGAPLQNSDHNTILLHSSCKAQLSSTYRPVLVWDFRDSNMSSFVHRLSCTDFDLIRDDDVDRSCHKFYELLEWSLSAVPRKLVFFSPNDKPWMTPVLKSLINNRWTAFRQRNWALYEHYKARVKQEITNSKRIWANKQSRSTRGLWNVVRTLQGQHMRDPFGRITDEVGGLEELLKQLTSEFKKNYNTNADVDFPLLSEQIWQFHVSPQAVFDQLMMLSSRKATGSDQVPPRLLKIGAHFLCVPLSKLFNTSIKKGVFPSSFKHAIVCPIPKCSNPTVKEFRPISLLSSISKVFERIVLENVKHELFQCYGAHQHAYRPISSTTTALIEICDHISRGLDCDQMSHVNVFCLDLSRAFEKLQHHRLLKYLSDRCLNHGFLRWLASYLSSRTLCVRVKNHCGPVFEIPSGVPQGSVLGPFLFAAFMGSFDFNDSNVYSTKYADDVTIVEHVHRNQTSVISLDECMSVFDSQGLSLNRSKCKQLCLRRSRQPPVVHDTGFMPVKSNVILGVQLTDCFKWKAQLSRVLKLASQRLHVIRCLKSCIPTTDLINIFHSLITSICLYASPVYGQLPATLMAKLDALQRRGHRMICGSLCDCDRFPGLEGKFEEAALRLLQQAESNPKHALHACVPQRLPASGQLRLTACATTRRNNSFFPWISRLCNARR